MTFISQGDSWLGVSITATNWPELNAQLSTLKAIQLHHPLLIEWRLDYWRDWRAESLHGANQEIRQQSPEQPLLLTVRTTAEGGQLALNASTYTNKVLQISGGLDWDLLDIMPAQLDPEIDLKSQLRKTPQQQLIYSYHILQPTSFSQDYQYLQKLAQQAGQDDVLKLAVQTVSVQNSLDLLNATLLTSHQMQQPLITMGMGDVGQITRQLGPLFGSVLSFGALTATGSAPGQLPLLQLDQLLIESD